MYAQKTIRAGKVIIIKKYHTSRLGKKGIQRGPKIEKTKEAQQKVNERRAIERLTWIIDENFQGGDMHISPTYPRGKCPPLDIARKQLEKFHRAMRALYKSKALEYKYVLATEKTRANMHHHMVVPHIDLLEIQKLWPHGKVILNRYLDDSGDYEKLAAYIIKETAETYKSGKGLYKKRWNQSANMREPHVETEIIKSGTWTKTPRARKGYYIREKEVTNGTHEITGFPYQYYTMIKIDRRC